MCRGAIERKVVVILMKILLVFVTVFLGACLSGKQSSVSVGGEPVVTTEADVIEEVDQTGLPLWDAGAESGD